MIRGLKMNTCNTCKHWDQEFYDNIPRGTCRHQKVNGAFGDEEDGLDHWDCAEFHSGPKFGCVHHEKA